MLRCQENYDRISCEIIEILLNILHEWMHLSVHVAPHGSSYRMLVHSTYYKPMGDLLYISSEQRVGL